MQERGPGEERTGAVAEGAKAVNGQLGAGARTISRLPECRDGVPVEKPRSLAAERRRDPFQGCCERRESALRGEYRSLLLHQIAQGRPIRRSDEQIDRCGQLVLSGEQPRGTSRQFLPRLRAVVAAPATQQEGAEQIVEAESVAP